MNSEGRACGWAAAASGMPTPTTTLTNRTETWASRSNSSELLHTAPAPPLPDVCPARDPPGCAGFPLLRCGRLCGLPILISSGMERRGLR